MNQAWMLLKLWLDAVNGAISMLTLDARKQSYTLGVTMKSLGSGCHQMECTRVTGEVPSKGQDHAHVVKQTQILALILLKNATVTLAKTSCTVMKDI